MSKHFLDVERQINNHVTIYGLSEPVKKAIAFKGPNSFSRQVKITLRHYELVFKSMLMLDFIEYSDSIVDFITSGLTARQAALSYAKKNDCEVYEGSRYFIDEELHQNEVLELSCDLKLKALQYASEAYLTDDYPNNWNEMSFQEQCRFIDDHISSEFEGWDGASLIPQIKLTSRLILKFYQKVS